MSGSYVSIAGSFFIPRFAVSFICKVLIMKHFITQNSTHELLEAASSPTAYGLSFINSLLTS